MATVAKEPAAAEKKQRPNALRSIIAGSTAGAIEIGMFLSHVLQLQDFFDILILRYCSHHLSRRMCVYAAAVLNETGEILVHAITRKLTRYMCSRKDKVAAQQTASRGQEAAMATLWSAVVCGMHHAHHRQLCQGGNPYARITQLAICIYKSKILTRMAGFVAFDQFKSMLVDENGKLSGPRTVLAGFGAGVTESLLAVTPTESIKTTLYALSFP